MLIPAPLLGDSGFAVSRLSFKGSQTGFYSGGGILVSEDGGFLLSLDGSVVHILASNQVNADYALTTDFDITAVTETTDYGATQGQPIGTEPQFADGGSKMVALDGSELQVYPLTTPYDWSTLGSATATDTGINATKFRITDDGCTLYLLVGDVLRNYTLTVPFDGRTTSLQNSINLVNRGMTDPECFTFNNDYSRLYGVERTAGEVAEFRMSTPGGLSTATQVGSAIDFATPSGMTFQPHNINFSRDGRNMYIMDAAVNVFWFETI